jgi:hypothetical protein
VAGWSVVAVLQSPRLPLLLLTASLGVLGGLASVAVRAPRPADRRFLAGAALAVLGALVSVGVGHHLGIGLATVALLAATSPPVISRITPSGP